MSNIRELIVKKFLWKRDNSLFCTHVIVSYKSGRTVDKSYYQDSSLPYTIQDYMNINNLKETKEIEQPGSLLDIRLAVYREE